MRHAGRIFSRVCRGFSYDQIIQASAWARRLLGVGRPKVRKKVIVRLTRAELETLLNKAYSIRGERGLMVELLVNTGARVAEFVNLQIEDFDPERYTIVIRQGKGGDDRIVPILRTVAEKVQVYLAATHRTTGPIFRSRQSDCYTPRRVQQIVRELAAEAGIRKRVYPHLMRHTVAQLLLEGGMPLEQVQRFLGHESITSTQIYAQSSTAMIDNSYRKALTDGHSAPAGADHVPVR